MKFFAFNRNVKFTYKCKGFWRLKFLRFANKQIKKITVISLVNLIKRN